MHWCIGASMIAVSILANHGCPYTLFVLVGCRASAVLTHWCVDVPMHWHIDTLMNWCLNMLIHQCVDLSNTSPHEHCPQPQTNRAMDNNYHRQQAPQTTVIADALIKPGHLDCDWKCHTQKGCRPKEPENCNGRIWGRHTRETTTWVNRSILLRQSCLSGSGERRVSRGVHVSWHHSDNSG